MEHCAAEYKGLLENASLMTGGDDCEKNGF